MLVNLDTIEYKPNSEGFCYYPLVTSTAVGLSGYLTKQNIENYVITLQEMLKESDNEEFISISSSMKRDFWEKRKKGLKCLKCKLSPKEVDDYRNQYNEISGDVEVKPYSLEKEPLDFEEEMEKWLLTDEEGTVD